MAADPQSYYNACAGIVTEMRNFSEVFIQSSYQPAVVVQDQGVINNFGITALTINVLGEPLYAVISTPPVVGGYNPAYVAGLNAYLNTLTTNANAITAALNAYAPLPAPNDDLATNIMTLIIQFESSTNTFRDPFNEGYPPLL